MPASRKRKTVKQQKSWAIFGLTGLFLFSMAVTAWWVSHSARLRVRLISPDQNFESYPLEGAMLDRG